LLMATKASSAHESKGAQSRFAEAKVRLLCLPLPWPPGLLHQAAAGIRRKAERACKRLGLWMLLTRTGMSAEAAPASDSVRRATASVAQYPSSHAAASAPV
jgi:hypothetical protein